MKQYRVGKYTITLSEEIVERLASFSENNYIIDKLQDAIDSIIDAYVDSYGFSDLMPAEECMDAISALTEAKRDYYFLSGLSVVKEEDSVQTPSEEIN